MAAYEIPFTPEPQTFVIALAGVDYRLTTVWNKASESWTLDIMKPDNTPIVTGIPIVTGSNLLHQYAYLGIAGKIFVQSAGDVTKIPGLADLGIGGLVFFITG